MSGNRGSTPDRMLPFFGLARYERASYAEFLTAVNPLRIAPRMRESNYRKPRPGSPTRRLRPLTLSHNDKLCLTSNHFAALTIPYCEVRVPRKNPNQ